MNCSCHSHSNVYDGQSSDDAVAVLEAPAPDAGHSHDAEAHEGYGRCSVSGCICPAYMGSGDLCENCGHNYTMHW